MKDVPAARSRGRAPGTKPSSSKAAPRQAPAVARRSRDLLGGALILVVEDHEDSRELFRSMLACHGAIVMTAASVDEAKRVIEVVRPAVVVTDIGLRHKPGTWLVDELRRTSRYASIPIIAVTGRDVPPTMAAMFDGFLKKPVDMDEFCGAIIRLLRRRLAG